MARPLFEDQTADTIERNGGLPRDDLADPVAQHLIAPAVGEARSLIAAEEGDEVRAGGQEGRLDLHIVAELTHPCRHQGERRTKTPVKIVGFGEA